MLCSSWTGKHKLDPKNAPKEILKILDPMCGLHNAICPADTNHKVDPSYYLDFAVSEDNDQQREMLKKDQQVPFDVKYHIKTWPKRWGETWKQILMVIGIIQNQWIILNGDYLECIWTEAELVQSVDKINDKQEEEENQERTEKG